VSRKQTKARGHLFFLCLIYICHRHANGANVNYPAIFIPGDGGSQIWARLNRTLPPPHYFCARHSNRFELWLDIRLLVPEVIDCFVDNMRLIYNATTKKTSNLDGVEIDIPGFGQTATVEYFDASGFSYSSYFAPIIRSLVALGYTRGVNLRGAPYVVFSLARLATEDILSLDMTFGKDSTSRVSSSTISRNW
jgi:hypothetical protein